MEGVGLSTPSMSTESLLLGPDPDAPSTSTAEERTGKRQRTDHDDPDFTPSAGTSGLSLPVPTASATRLVHYAWERMTADTTSTINNHGKNNDLSVSSFVDKSNYLSNNTSIVQNNGSDTLSKSVTIKPARFVPTMGNNQSNEQSSLAVQQNKPSNNRNYVQTRLSFNNAQSGAAHDKSPLSNNTNNTVGTSTTIRQSIVHDAISIAGSNNGPNNGVPMQIDQPGPSHGGQQQPGPSHAGPQQQAQQGVFAPLINGQAPPAQQQAQQAGLAQQGNAAAPAARKERLTLTDEQAQAFRRLRNAQDKLIRYKLHRDYLSRYLEARIIPKGLLIKCTPYIGATYPEVDEMWNNTLRETSLRLLELTIHKVNRSLENLNAEWVAILHNIEHSNWPDNIKTDIVKRVSELTNLKKNQIQQTKNSKWVRDQHGPSAGQGVAPPTRPPVRRQNIQGNRGPVRNRQQQQRPQRALGRQQGRLARGDPRLQMIQGLMNYLLK